MDCIAVFGIVWLMIVALISSTKNVEQINAIPSGVKRMLFIGIPLGITFLYWAIGVLVAKAMGGG